MSKQYFSKIGFILAAAGSAVGLGNIWRFPYIAGEYGGGAFVLVYIAALLLVGIPVLMAEILLGKMGKDEPVSSYENLAPDGKKWWRFAGFSFITGFLILTFYSVVLGWVFAYVFITLTGLPSSAEAAKDLFMTLLQQDLATQLFFHLISTALVGFIVLRGIKQGIEKVNNILMPLLIFMLIFMLVYAFTLDSFGKAISFMFAPDFSKLSSEAVLVAVGQAFFSLSVGMVVMLTYASFANQKTKVFNSAIIITIFDALIAIVAGVAMFAFLFEQNMPSSQGAGLAFISMPAVFFEFGSVGVVLSLLFFISLAFAGLTSAISILEPTVSHLIKQRKYSRKKATFVPLIAVYLLGVVALVSNVSGFEFLTFGSKNLFDWFDFVTAAIMLPIGGLFVAIFMGFVVDKNRIVTALKTEGLSSKTIGFWFFLLRYVAPIAIIGVIGAKMMGL